MSASAQSTEIAKTLESIQLAIEALAKQVKAVESKPDSESDYVKVESADAVPDSVAVNSTASNGATSTTTIVAESGTNTAGANIAGTNTAGANTATNTTTNAANTFDIIEVSADEPKYTQKELLDRYSKAIANNDCYEILYCFTDGLDATIATGSECEPLHILARYGNVGCIKKYIPIVDIRSMPVDKNGKTPLHYTAQYNKPDNCSYLCLMYAAQIDSTDVELGMTALMLAITYNNSTCARILLAYGSSVSKTDTNGNSVLHYAVRHPNIPIIEKLLECGADINATNKYGYPPLFSAVCEDNLDGINTLIKHGATVDMKASNGWTPLAHAIRYSNVECASALIKAGADLDYAMKVLDSEFYNVDNEMKAFVQGCRLREA